MHQRLSQPLRWIDALQHMRHFYQMTHLTSNSCRSLMFMDARCTSTCHKTHNHLDEWMLSSTWDTSTKWYISHRIVVAHSCSTQAFRSKEIIFLYINYSLAHNFKFWSKVTQLDSMEQDSKSLTWTRVKKYIHMNSYNIHIMQIFRQGVQHFYPLMIFYKIQGAYLCQMAHWKLKQPPSVCTPCAGQRHSRTHVKHMSDIVP